MVSNFYFDGSVGIRLGEDHYDLHSFFSVSRMTLSQINGTVEIELAAIEEYRRHVHGAKTLRWTFSGVNYIEVSPGFCGNKSDTIEEIGFKEPNDRDDEWLKPTEKAAHSDHLFIRFSSLEFVRLSYSYAHVDVD